MHAHKAVYFHMYINHTNPNSVPKLCAHIIVFMRKYKRRCPEGSSSGPAERVFDWCVAAHLIKTALRARSNARSHERAHLIKTAVRARSNPIEMRTSL